jgi:magnesium-transporting ATPase (P-type)
VLVIVLTTGSVINGLFGLLIVANSVIGMVQEIGAKQTLDKLASVGQAKPLVRRQSGTQTLMPSEVVLDDIIELGPGDQVVVDGEIVEQENLEVDESLLTGEADPIAKAAGDAVMSGSFVVAGIGAYRATKVGPEAYAAKLAEEASKFTLVKSELRNGINRILQLVTYLLVPAGLLTIYTQFFTTHAGWRQAVPRTVGALVPTVPEGLVLLTSVAFAVGVVRLGQRQCLVQELPAIEGLARVDVVCGDKTGTLTENGMRVSDVERLPAPSETVDDALATADPRPNASMQAIDEAFHQPPGWIATATAPFRSATKWSGVSYRDHGNWVIGAPDVPRWWCSSRGAPRRPRDVGLLCRAGRFGQGDLRRQRGVGRGGRRQARLARRYHGRPSTPDRRGRTGRRAGLPHHLRPSAARSETCHRARAAIARARRGDDRRRRQRCAGPQRRRHRRRDGRGQSGVARWPTSSCWTTGSPRCPMSSARAVG